MWCRRRSWYIVPNVAFLDNVVSVVALFCLLNPPWKEFPVRNVTSSSHKWWSALTYTRDLRPFLSRKEDIVLNINVSVLGNQFSYSTLCYHVFTRVTFFLSPFFVIQGFGNKLQIKGMVPVSAHAFWQTVVLILSGHPYRQ